MQKQKQLISLGVIVQTVGVKESIPENDVYEALERHSSGDWGIVSREDKIKNNQALEFMGKILSSYISSNDIRFSIITEADRSYTTILLPREY